MLQGGAFLGCALFPGSDAGASLKRLFKAPEHKLDRLFPGSDAGASLKQRLVARHRRAGGLFPGSDAGASLKRVHSLGRAPDAGALPRQ